jgi:hypothetical protein
MKKIFLKVIKWIWMSILAFAAYELIIGALLFTYITRAGNYYGIADMDIELSSLYRDHYIMDSLEAQRYHEKSDKQSADSMMILAIEYREKSERYINVHMPDDRKTAEDAEKFVKTLFKLDIINIWGPTTLTPDDLKRRFPDDFDKLDLDEINRRRTILMDRGYTDFTWYHNTYKQACKVYRDYEFQGDGWQVYCCTGHNVHLMTNEQFQAELDALPGKERVAEEDHKRWIAHFFVGDIDIAERFVDLGFTVSFSGVITFANDYDDSVRFVPISMIHAETDSPYATPAPFRGQRNTPLMVQEIVARISVLRQEELEEVRAELLENARRMFGV